MTELFERPKWECPNCGTDEFHFPDEMEVWHDCKQIQLDKLKEEIALIRAYCGFDDD